MTDRQTGKSDTIAVRVKSMTWEAEAVLRLALAPLSGQLPDPEPGAHVDLHLPNGTVRQYSLTIGSSPACYVLGVLKDPKSRGGSRFVHDALRPGDTLDISPPRNAFSLIDSDDPVLLISGGVGITPILAMAERLSKGPRDWSLIACTRSHGLMGFSHDILRLGGMIRADDQDGRPDLNALVGNAKPETHLYCCGPAPMLDAFVDAADAAGFPPAQVHLERFELPKPKADEGEIIVELARSGETLIVAPDQTVLDAILAAGIDVPSSCRVGVCGTCETQVLAGDVDHRDLILTEDERAEGKMMICCSRAKSQNLVLDI